MKHAKKLITLLVILIFVAYFALNVGQFKPLLHVNVYLLFVIAIADFLAIAANGLFIKFILEPFGKYISVIESVYVSLISAVGNFFAPIGAGFGFRAVYLKKKHGLKYGDFISTLYGNYIIVFLVNSFFALLALYLLRGKQDSEYFVLVAIFGSLFGVSLLLSLVKLPELNRELKNKHLNRLAKTLLGVIKGWNQIVSNKKLLTRLIAIVVFNFAIALTVARLEIAALHFSITFPALLLFSVLGFLSLFVNITPANLGVKEAIYIFSASVIGFSTGQILSIALIDRGVLFIVLAASWFISSRTKNTRDLLSIGQIKDGETVD